MVRIALANLPFPASPQESVGLAVQAIAQASADGAAIVCFPECYVPGYRRLGEAAFLERAWSSVREAAKGKIAVILGTERLIGDARRITAMVVNPDGTIAGFQDKVQLDPSEEDVYSAGTERQVFQPVG